MRRSRISNKFKKKSQKTLILSVLGIIFVFAVIFKFGIPFIVTVGGIFEKVSQPAAIQNNEHLAEPILDDLPTATNEENLKVTGSSSPEVKIELFLSGDVYEEVTSKEDGSFSFDVKLSKGDNIIKARAKNDENVSEFSKSQTVSYKNSPPELSIDSPSDGSSTNTESINVSGKTENEVTVTVNGFWAVLNSDGTFSYNLKLNQGENKILVVATDEAGNETEKEIKVTYSP